jgi:hypothetical protein
MSSMQACKASIWGLEGKLLLYMHVTATATCFSVFYTSTPAHPSPHRLSFLAYLVCTYVFQYSVVACSPYFLSHTHTFSSWVRDMDVGMTVFFVVW